jgi:predicted metal-dependent hydrolase
MSEEVSIETVAGPARLRRSRRKSLAISVHPDGALELVAPLEAPLETIRKKVAKRASWIAAQRQGFQKMNAVRLAPRYVSGATHRYLGRQYRLKVSVGAESKVILRDAYFHVQVRERSEESVKKALDEWFRRLAHEQFRKRLAKWSDWCRQRHLPEPRLRLRRMPKRWGSALPDGTIYLNPELIHASSACIDYVITHEICHLKHPDHGPEFYGLLKQLLPDWRHLKARLESGEW